MIDDQKSNSLFLFLHLVRSDKHAGVSGQIFNAMFVAI
jgi:hypothetical protein